MSKWLPPLTSLFMSPHNHFSYFRCDSQEGEDTLGTPYYCRSWNELLSSLVMLGRVKNIIKGWKNRGKVNLLVVYVSGGPPLSYFLAKEILPCESRQDFLVLPVLLGLAILNVCFSQSLKGHKRKFCLYSSRSKSI